MRELLHVFVSICLSCLAFTAHAAEDSSSDVSALYSRMEVAVKQLNYEGVFTYQTGSKLQSVRILHRADKDGEKERLLSLNGAPLEILRTNDEVKCIFPAGKPDGAPCLLLKRGFPSDLLLRLTTAVPHYHVALGGQGRVANCAARELLMTPRDNFRYGYRLWIDKESDLLLQSDLLNDRGEVLEKFSFSWLKLNNTISDNELQPTTSGQEISWRRSDPIVGSQRVQKKAMSLWKVTWLPEGFELVAEQVRRMADSEHSVEQRVYSDGLSLMSIFIEKNSKKRSHLKGVSNMGPINAFGSVINEHLVTVVGQVPQRTVEKIGHSINFSAEQP